jgi:hypothetical protein
LSDWRSCWVDGIESESAADLEPLIADLLARVPGRRKAAYVP